MDGNLWGPACAGPLGIGEMLLLSRSMAPICDEPACDAPAALLGSRVRPSEEARAPPRADPLVAQHRDDGGRAGKLSDRSAGSVARATALALCFSDAMTLISTS